MSSRESSKRNHAQNGVLSRPGPLATAGRRPVTRAVAKLDISQGPPVGRRSDRISSRDAADMRASCPAECRSLFGRRMRHTLQAIE